MQEKAIVLFDGLCSLCCCTVVFLKKRDHKQALTFISMHNSLGKALMKKHVVTLEMDTLVLIKGSKAFIRSDAILGIASILGGLWGSWRPFSLIPRPLRDKCYSFVARRRYQYFSRDAASGAKTAKHDRKSVKSEKTGRSHFA